MQNSSNYIDELQNQIKNGGLKVLKNKSNEILIQNQTYTIEKKEDQINLNNAFDDTIDNTLKSEDLSLSMSNIDQYDAHPSTKILTNAENIKLISQLRVANPGKFVEIEIPEWKRKLIEKKKQKNNIFYRSN